jgi:hypothetical protein
VCHLQVDGTEDVWVGGAGGAGGITNAADSKMLLLQDDDGDDILATARPTGSGELSDATAMMT